MRSHGISSLALSLFCVSLTGTVARAQAVPTPPPVRPLATPTTSTAGDAKTQALINAIRDGDANRITSALDAGANINTTDNNLSTPLMQAAAIASADIVRLLLDKGAEGKARDKNGFTPLLIAAYAGHTDTVQLLLEKGADPNDADKDQRTVLMGAAYSGKIETVRLLLDKGVPVTATDKDGFTALMVAAGSGNVELVQLLLDKGAAVDAATKTGFTPLMQACGAGKPDVVALLIARGADIQAKANRGARPILVASYAGNVAIVKQLLNRGVDVNVADGVGHTPLIGAAFSGNATVARMLLDNGARIKMQTSAGLDALMQAAYSGRREVAKLLLERGAPVDSRTSRGLTPLMQAVGSGNEAIARMLLEYGADVNAADASNQTPAVWAKKRGHEEMHPLLKKAGAVIDGVISAPSPIPTTPTSPLTALKIAPPSTPAKPAIHGPHVVGGSPNVPFLYRIPATGTGPLRFSAKGFPPGLTLDTKTGILSGSLRTTGTTPVTITATNASGTSSPFSLSVVCGPHKVALTPPMGWSAWNLYGDTIDDAKVRLQADWLIKSGLAAHGFNYILLDDSWQGRRDTQTGEITVNQRLRSIKAIADYLHARGLKLGLYSSPNAETSGGYTGSKDHVDQDAKTFASWGIDYLKYDWSDNTKGRFQVPADMVRDEFARMRKALDAQNRDIVFGITPYGFGGMESWGEPPVNANSWWTATQVIESWEGMSRNGFQLAAGFARPAGPGHWNDPGWLLTGKVGSATINPHFTKLDTEEQKTQITLWCIVAAPLILSCDLTQLDPNRFFPITTALLTNDEVLAIDQDALGHPGDRVVSSGRTEVWARPLADGTLAVAFFNRGESAQKVKFDWSDLPEDGEMKLSGPQPVRDLWTHADLGTVTDSFSATVPRHGAMLVKIGKPK